MKVNQKFPKMPLSVKSNPILRNCFFNLMDERAKDIIAKKVSKMNGDVRVAFDILKSAFVELQTRVKYFTPDGADTISTGEDDNMPDPSTVKITFDLVLKVFNQKYGSKLPETLRSLPR
jgi:hypothetical protein